MNKKMLLVKINKLGDMINFIPTIAFLRQGWPGAHLTLLTTGTGREVMEATGLVDRIWEAGQREVRTFTGFFKCSM